ncbi:MAG: hypothetical protein Kow0063_28210 [Anaerolineae bacterium]
MDLRPGMNFMTCPDCGRTISLKSQLREGQRFTCLNCGAFLEIINLEPPELDWAFSGFDMDWEPVEELWGEEEWSAEEWDEGTGFPDDREL